MGHTPSAVRGRALITDGNSDIMAVIQDQCDVAMAKQEADRVAGARAIKKRHADEMKAFKRNHKHRAKRIKDRMKSYEDMDPLEFADQFKHFVDDDLFVSYGPFDFNWIPSRMVSGRMSAEMPNLITVKGPSAGELRKMIENVDIDLIGNIGRAKPF